MKKPKILKELYDLVNPSDLNEVLGFSGINDKPNTEHYKTRKEFSEIVWNSKGKYDWKVIGYCNQELSDKHYDTIIKCLQDFYRWSRGFNHEYAHIYKRVINALDIPMEHIKN